MTPRSLFSRAVSAGLLAAALALAFTPAASAEPEPGAKGKRRTGFDLLQAGQTYVLQLNRVLCGLDASQAKVCTDTFGSPVGGGGYWPAGSPNQYIFNSGIQVAGIIPYDAGFSWAGDTVGAFFFDAEGFQPHAEGIEPIWSSQSEDDLSRWPGSAVVRDANVYDAALIDRKAASQEDTWTRAFDGPEKISNREHAMGILIDQRSLSWRYPTGNEDIVYFIYTLTNITSPDPTSYAGIDDSARASIVAIAQNWVDRVKVRSGITDYPASGFRFDSLYASFGMDPDVGFVIDVNSSSAVLPFNMGFAYKSDFNEPTWLYTPDSYASPLGPYPGFVGVKYLKSPINPATGEEVGLSLFSNTSNGPPFDDPTGDIQLWRYLSGRIDQGGRDPFCDRDPIEDRLCALLQEPVDTRFYQSSGPFSLGPGQQATIVVAYVHAWPVASAITPSLPGIIPPGFPPSGAGLATGIETPRVIDRAMGWVSHSDVNGDGEISQDEVVTADNSLLRKALVAQDLFDAKFLLPFAPEAPAFFLVPGDNQVTVVWQPSATEDPTSEKYGDPYFDIAGNPASALYDPNYRRVDVEGYRIYRGRSRAQLELIAQFDYAGTTFADYTGWWAYEGNCAPEFGILTGCPADFPLTPGVDDPVLNPLVGDISQVPTGGRVVLQSGDVLIIDAVNPVEDAGFPALRDTGVPFAFIDQSVVNSVTYYYAVSAFDVNSLASGPPSLESALRGVAVTPRAPSGQVVTGVLQTMELVGADGTVLDASAPLPTIDPATGKFSGPMPPTDGWMFAMSAFLPDVLVDGQADLRIDSVVPGDAFGGTYGDIKYYMTATGSAGTFQVELPGFQNTFHSGSGSSSATFPLVAFDDAKAGLFGGDGSYQLSAGTEVTVPGAYRLASWGRGDINGDPGDGITVHAGPRWFSGDNETQDDPNGGFASPSNSFAGSDQVWTDLSHTAGELPGVDLLWRPASYSTVNFEFRNVESITSTVYRAADFEVIWGPNGTIESVTDLTHQVPVPFNAGIRASWGLLTDQSFVGVVEANTDDRNNGLLTWADVACLPEIARSPNRTMCRRTATPAHFVNTATLSPISDGTSSFADASALTPSGNGFIFYLNGHFFLMRMTALPAAGTSWKARFFAGYIRGTPGADDYEFGSSTRPPAVPGLTARLTYTGTGLAEAVTDSMLAAVHTVPDPYYATNSYERSPANKVLKFVNLPPQAIIRIYSLSGVLVDVIEHNDVTLGGEATWDLRNRNNQFVASGVYFYHVETLSGAEKIGRFTVVNSGSIVIFGQ